MRTERQVRSNWPIGIVIGLLASVVSVGRLWLFDQSAPAQVLWAEDGLFTLCIHKADFLTCLVDPFAGYLLFLPRVLVWPISVLPWEHWAIAANITAALLAGVVSFFALIIMRRFGVGWYTSVFVALLPVIAPMSGLEAINAIGSSYMLLLFLAVLLVAAPPISETHNRSGVYVWAGALLLLVTALTIPSAVVLGAIIVIAVIRGAWPVRTSSVWLAALAVGLLIQLYTVMTADSPRQIDFGAATLNSWVDSIPISLLTYWPGLSIGPYEFFTNFSLSPLGITGWLVTAFLLVLGIWLIARNSRTSVASGLLVLAGLGLGLIPSAIGYANNRYFVVPVLLWGAAALIGLDDWIRRARPLVLVVVTAIIALIWSPAFAASAFRATPAPPWSEEVARVEARCQAEPDATERPIFTPFWPPNWGDGLTEPTHPNLPCPVVWRWVN